MGYRVKGTLKLPDGSPASNAEIEFISRKNFSPLVQELKSNMLCGPTGAYDVTLEFGEYAVIVYPGGTYPAALGIITLATDTVAGQDLPTLLQQAGWQPATPEYITQINTWLAQSSESADMAKNEADRSTAQADRARSEADRAAQITGINTVMEAIEQAALPLPDLWAPLTDSVRLITGYGREVKVGEDVIASFLEFSRPTAATTADRDGLPVVVKPNVPRFDNSWMVLEGPATNLVTWSEDLTHWFSNNQPSIEAEPGIFTKITPFQQFSGKRIEVSGLILGAKYNLSFWAYTAQNAAPGQFIIGIEGVPSPSITATPTRYSVQFVAQNTTVGIVAYGAAISGSLDPFYVGGFQVESGDVETSYIPTSGAAATRAADSMTVKKENLHTGNLSLAVEVDTLRSYSGYSAHVYRENGSSLWLRREGETNSVSAPGLQVGLSSALGTCVHRVRRIGESPCVKLRAGAARGEALFRLNPFTGPLVFGTQGGEPCFTKIRNLRIWRQYLTDEQEKAVV